MSEVTFRRFDASAYLADSKDIEDYLALAIEEGDAKTIQLVLRDIAKAQGMTQLAKDTGLNRESLYKALSAQGNPSFASILKITQALGLKLTLRHTG
ncbi:addiction module antidote protein [Boudabousia marimammalium]|uniref:Putative addiction module antidote protein n=1 Tax=Boudabousia marimammalium TaxID=156892 RepID=A0A1Q5PSB5_9ACTO|nr:addiction module antidote protein [Boudabousia marimammalium]OKL50474.1 putative addiction module antidote protein [Boudabousia marimammalium]